MNTEQILTDYVIEVLQTQGQQKISLGRLGYIKEHLKNLLDLAKNHE